MRSITFAAFIGTLILTSSCRFLGVRQEVVVIGDPEVVTTETESEANKNRIEKEVETAFSVESVNRLLMPGTYHGEDVEYDPMATSWLGLYMHEGRSVLRPVDLKVSRAFDPVLDGPGDSTALRFHVNKADSLLVGLFSGWSGMIKEKEIETYPIGFPLSLEPDVQIQLNASCQFTTQIKGNTGLTVKYQPLNDTYVSGVIHEVAELDDTFLQLLWAGDLNDDGYPDLILNKAHKYSYSHLALYLSNGDGSCAVRQLADFRFTAC